MPFEVIHFRESDKILKEKRLVKDVKETLEYIDDVLYALISDPDGLIHRVQPENYLGRNHGRVLSVYDDRIELQELVRNGADGWMPRDAKVALDES